MNWRRGATAVAGAALVIGAAVACSHHQTTRSAPPHPSPTARPSRADIFALLPFSQNQLDTAYTAAARATAAYQTFSWTDTPSSYGSRAAPWVSSGYLTYLEQTYGNPAATAARARLHEHSSATSSVLSIRTFGATSITFIVHISQADPDTNDSGDYAATAATTDGTQWQVSDIEPAGAGNS